MAGKYLTDSEFKRKVKKIHGSQFAILSAYKGMHSKVKVRCNTCSWQKKVQAASLLNPNYGTGCPNHGGRQFNSSSFQKAINQTQDGQYTLLSEYVNARTKVKIRCNICGVEFHAWPGNLLNGRIGKNCNHKIQLDFEQASKQLSKISNEEIKLIHFSGMHSLATFKCCKCGNVWRARANNVFSGSEGCPRCASSKGEKAVAEYLKENEISFEPQFKIGACRDKLPLPFDFAVFNKGNFLNCLIEYQGCQHFIDLSQYKKKGPFSTKSVSRTQKHDAMKLSFCQKHGIKLIYIDHPQTTGASNKSSFITDLVKKTLDKELKVS